jgi:tetratricopeptide (TPR) repeat protein
MTLTLANADGAQQLLEEAENRFSAGDYESALRCSDQVLKADPENLLARITRGAVLARRGRYLESLADSERAWQIDRSGIYTVLIQRNREAALRSLGRDGDADAAVQLARTALNAWKEAAGRAYSSGQFNEALAWCELIKANGALDVWSVNVLGCCHASRDKHDEALRHFDLALKHGGLDPIVIENKGESLFALKRYEEALNCFQEALKLSPELELARKGEQKTLAARQHQLAGEGPNKSCDGWNAWLSPGLGALLIWAILWLTFSALLSEDSPTGARPWTVHFADRGDLRWGYNAEVRMEAALRMSGSTNHLDLRALVRALRRDPEVAPTVAAVLIDIGRPALRVLRKALKFWQRKASKAAVERVIEAIEHKAPSSQPERRSAWIIIRRSVAQIAVIFCLFSIFLTATHRLIGQIAETILHILVLVGALFMCLGLLSALVTAALRLCCTLRSR